MRRRLAAVVIILFALGGAASGYLYLHRNQEPPQYQGWVEADFVFVSPDEMGRIEKLVVREGTHVTPGALLFTLDEDLQQAAVAENEAAVVNAKQAYDRAKSLLKNAVGSKKTFDDAEAALRSAEAGSTPCARGSSVGSRSSPVAGTIQEVYFREGEMVSLAGRLSRSCRRRTSRYGFSCRRRCCPTFTSAIASASAATGAPPTSLPASVSSRPRRSSHRL